MGLWMTLEGWYLRHSVALNIIGTALAFLGVLLFFVSCIVSVFSNDLRQRWELRRRDKRVKSARNRYFQLAVRVRTLDKYHSDTSAFVAAIAWTFGTCFIVIALSALLFLALILKQMIAPMSRLTRIESGASAIFVGLGILCVMLLMQAAFRNIERVGYYKKSRAAAVSEMMSILVRQGMTEEEASEVVGTITAKQDSSE